MKDYGIKIMEINAPIVAKARPRFAIRKGKIMVYPKEESVIYENLIRIEWQKQTNNFKFESDAPIFAHIVAVFKPSNENKKLIDKNQHFPALGCTIHKDLDNIAKTVLDALNGIAYDDDKQIVSLIVDKRYCRGDETEHITVALSLSLELSKLELSSAIKIEENCKKIAQIYKDNKEEFTFANSKKAEKLYQRIKKLELLNEQLKSNLRVNARKEEQ